MDRKQLKVLEPFLRMIKKKYSPEKIILFGSRARGDNLGDSDYDLIIVSEKFRDYEFYDRLVNIYKLQNIPVDIEVICLTPDELKERLTKIGIIREAVKEGIEI